MGPSAATGIGFNLAWKMFCWGGIVELKIQETKNLGNFKI